MAVVTLIWAIGSLHRPWSPGANTAEERRSGCDLPQRRPTVVASFRCRAAALPQASLLQPAGLPKVPAANIGSMSGDGSLIDFYESGPEAVRLQSREGLVEFLRTQRVLRSILEPASRILDVGGASGAHADWLVRDGHRVQVVDIVPGHVDDARSRGSNAQVGDARVLAFVDQSFDAVLLLGPLYHLIDPSDRARALAEARRVARPGGLVVAAAVSRIAVALDYLRKGRLDSKDALDMVARICANGHDDTGFGAGIFYFHTVDELRTELVDAGLSDVAARGLEGPAWPLIAPGTGGDDPIIGLVDAIAEMADHDESLTGASSHVLAIGRRTAS